MSGIPQKDRKWLPFEEARTYVRSLGFKTQQEWHDFCRSGQRPSNIPSAPYRFYKQEWKNYPDWIGTEFLPFEEARAYVRSLGLKNNDEWRAYCASGERPVTIPSNANTVYKDSWQNWPDWLGSSGIPTRRKYLSFEEARDYARALKLRNHAEWVSYCKTGRKPLTIPVNPDKIYPEFKGYGDFLGTGTVALFNREYLPFEEARDYVRALHLKSDPEWRVFCKSGTKPVGIPSSPWNIYRTEWVNLGDWLGTGAIASQQQKRTPEQRRITGRVKYHKRRACKQAVSGSYTAEQIAEQLKRQHYKCYYLDCGQAKFKKIKGKYIYVIEHTFPLARVAGSGIPANSMSYLVLACPTCNAKKGKKFPHEWFEGGRLL